MAYAMQIATYVVTYTMYPLALASGLVRVYCRVFITQNWGADDYFAVASMFGIAGQIVQWQIMMSLGCGAPEPNKCNYADPEGGLLRSLFAQEIYYYLVHWVIKSSFLVFYFRLSSQRNFRIAIWAGIALNTVMLIYNELISILQCDPVAAVLEPMKYPDAKCIERLIVFFTPAGFNVLVDIYILALPIPTIWRLQMPLRRKLAVLSVFSFGISGILVGLVRFHALVTLNELTNTAYNVGEMIVVACLEFSLAMISLNLPAMKCLVPKLVGKYSQGSSSGQKGYKGYSGTSDAKKGYGLSTLGRKAQKNKLNELGTITRMEQGVKGSESEEELWKQSAAMQAGKIVVTKDVMQQSSSQTSNDPSISEEQQQKHYEPWGDIAVAR